MPLLVVGIDGLGFDNLTQWLGRWMPYTYSLTTKYYTRRIPLEIAISPRNWTLIFSGKALDWYRLYVKPVGNGRWRLIRRWELPVRFIWDMYPDMVVINAPVVCPPVCKNTGFRPVAYGMHFTVPEWLTEIRQVTDHAVKALNAGKNTVACYLVVDRMLHVTADEGVIAKVCRELDNAVMGLHRLAVQKGYRWVIVSDHGMRRKSPEKYGSVAPRHDMPYIRTVTKAVHEHSPDALYISNIDCRVEGLQDVFKAIVKGIKE